MPIPPSLRFGVSLALVIFVLTLAAILAYDSVPV